MAEMNPIDQAKEAIQHDYSAIKQRNRKMEAMTPYAYYAKQVPHPTAQRADVSRLPTLRYTLRSPRLRTFPLDLDELPTVPVRAEHHVPMFTGTSIKGATRLQRVACRYSPFYVYIPKVGRFYLAFLRLWYRFSTIYTTSILPKKTVVCAPVSLTEAELQQRLLKEKI